MREIYALKSPWILTSRHVQKPHLADNATLSCPRVMWVQGQVISSDVLGCLILINELSYAYIKKINLRAFVQPSNEETRPLQPFLRWAGGKRWLVKKENQIAPLQFDTYIEPFLGSAAVFFSISSTNFIISDINAELINCYMAIRNNHEEIEGLLRIHQAKHSKDYYYQIRESQPKTEQTKAARFLYLNRTCFNGLYRVNHQGKFNVPIVS